MKYDQAVQLAREAGLFIPRAGIPENGALMRFANLVAEYERESCAAVCDDLLANPHTGGGWSDAVIEAAATIRSRSKL